MFPYFVLGIALLAGFLLAGRWYATADPKRLVKVLKWSLLGIIALVILFFAATGRLTWAFLALPALIPWIMRMRTVARMAKTFQRMSTGAGPAGQTSDVETAFLRMTLDHDSGEMSGDVIEGRHRGKQLAAMPLMDLLDLLTECYANDGESAQVLVAYLDRAHPDWREAAGYDGQDGDSGTAGPGGPMSRDEALQVLGLEAGATEADIKDAHRRLIANLHPDHGGSDYLAAQINQAKDVLLGT